MRPWVLREFRAGCACAPAPRLAELRRRCTHARHDRGPAVARSRASAPEPGITTARPRESAEVPMPITPPRASTTRTAGKTGPQATVELNEPIDRAAAPRAPGAARARDDARAGRSEPSVPRATRQRNGHGRTAAASPKLDRRALRRIQRRRAGSCRRFSRSTAISVPGSTPTSVAADAEPSASTAVMPSSRRNV